MKVYRNGVEADVPDDLGDKLLGEGWTKGAAKVGRKPAAKATAKAAPETQET